MDHVVCVRRAWFKRAAAFSALDKANNSAEYLFKGALFSVTAAFSVKRHIEEQKSALTFFWDICLHERVWLSFSDVLLSAQLMYGMQPLLSKSCRDYLIKCWQDVEHIRHSFLCISALAFFCSLPTAFCSCSVLSIYIHKTLSGLFNTAVMYIFNTKNLFRVNAFSHNNRHALSVKAFG